ncbi:MAG: hypothetical protein HY650_08840 [Acidobacteria bacterium]|nr:hypothetical protein [Acidobacteriota bacterium]
MSYRHFARFGDIWKHLPLCTFLSIEQPRRYIDTNSAYPAYELSQTPEQEYGIGHFSRNVGRELVLESSAYWRILYSLPENRTGITRYLGSPGLALRALGGVAAEFVFFDIESECLLAIAAHSRELGIEDRVRCLNQDSLDGLQHLIPTLDPDDFLFIDPYSAIEAQDHGRTYLDHYVEAMRHGAKGMLWYGYQTSGQRREMHRRFHLRQQETPATSLNGFELTLGLMGEKPAPVNPGIMGCGILTGNLSAYSLDLAQQMAQALTRFYDGSTLFDRYPGDLILESFQIEV